MNQTIFDFLHGYFGRSKFLDAVFIFIAAILPYLTVIFILFYLFFISTSSNELLLFIFPALIAWILAMILKEIFRASRPTSRKVLTLFPFESRFSFPSEHSAIFSALGTAAYFSDQNLGLVLLSLALFIGIMRIVIGVHYPRDIVAGWALGILCSLFFVRILL